MEVKEANLGDKLNGMAGIAKEAPKPKDNSTMDKETFLKMFMQQLKYQDPLNPMKNEQFAQQMAQFSQVEQQINTNKNLEMLVNASSNKQAEAFQLLGKEIVSHRALLSHEKDKPSNINFKLPKEAEHLKVHIIDPAGQKIRTMELGPTKAGDVRTKWDGLADDSTFAETGKYSFRVEAYSADGNQLAVPDKVNGLVTGITRKEGKTYLMVGEELVEYKELTEVKEPSKEVAVNPTQPAENPAAAVKDVKQVVAENDKTDKKSSGTQNVSIQMSEDAEKGLAGDNRKTANTYSPLSYFDY